MSNLVPGPLCRMVAAMRAGKVADAKAIAARLEPLFKLVGCKVTSTRVLPNGQEGTVEDKIPNPGPVKTMMAGVGMPVGICRRPLGKMPREAVDRCRAALQDLYKVDPDALKPIGETFGVNVANRLSDDSVWAELSR